MRKHSTSTRRLIAVGGIAAAAIIAGGAISIAAAGDNDGRERGVSPGAPFDAPAPADLDAPIDNGRGGIDPAPRLVADPSAASAAVGDVGEIDTDSGVVEARATAAPAANDAASQVREAPTDLDDPGQPTAVDQPVVAGPGDVGDNDQDG